MKKIVVIVVVLVLLVAILGGLAYADMRVRHVVEEHARAKITETLPQAQGVGVEIDGFPFVLGVLMSGEVEALHVTVDAVEEQGLRATELSLHVESIQLDTDALLDESRLVVTGIGRATAEGFVSDDEVSKLSGHTVEFGAGTARAEVQGQVIEAAASIQGRLVFLSSNLEGVPPLMFPLPSSELLPCAPQAELMPGKIRLACSVTELPAALRDAMAQR